MLDGRKVTCEGKNVIYSKHDGIYINLLTQRQLSLGNILIRSERGQG